VVYELAEASARIACEVTDGYATRDRPRWVIGSVGPGTRLPTLGHELRHPDSYQQNAPA
jgi:5-methyltetrahydrofolate--homocysteine methyltransferase